MAKNITFEALSTEDTAYKSITILQGTSFTLAITPKGVGGVAVDTTGYELAGQFRTVYGRSASHFDGRAVLTFSVSEGNVVNDTANGRFLVPFTDAITSALGFKGDELEGVYDFELKAPDGSKSRPLYGPFVVKREATTV